jgi:hypothetical protein
MDFSAEVLMYIQKVKLYLATNVEAREYFLGKGSEDIFLKHLGEIAQKNFDKQQDATLNKEQCERIRVAKYPETAPEYTDYLTCTFTGLISDMTKDQAGKKLKDQLIKMPNINGLIKLGPELLKQSSSLYDLIEFENIIWRIDPNLQNNFNLNPNTNPTNNPNKILTDTSNIDDRKKRRDVRKETKSKK